jgi:hypothetical protein
MFSGSLNSIVLAETVKASMSSLKVTVTVLLTGTPVVPLAGFTAIIAGGVVSGATVV